MTNELVRALVDNHNAEIDNFINGELAEKLGAKDGKVNITQWFEAQRLISEQKFYERGMTILKPCRELGFNVKMDMQSNKLVF